MKNRHDPLGRYCLAPEEKANLIQIRPASFLLGHASSGVYQPPFSTRCQPEPIQIFPKKPSTHFLEKPGTHFSKAENLARNSITKRFGKPKPITGLSTCEHPLIKSVAISNFNIQALVYCISLVLAPNIRRGLSDSGSLVDNNDNSRGLADGTFYHHLPMSIHLTFVD